MTKIKINNVELYAYHGVSLEEKNLGGKFSYDLEITFDISKASQTDNIEDTIDYAFIINLVSEFILVNKFNLLEKLVVEICKLVIYKFQNIQKIKINLRKHQPPINCYINSVELEYELINFISVSYTHLTLPTSDLV